MGAALCGPMKALDEESRKIEEELRRERYEEKRRVKILLLGSSDSGKSTIAKQMRIIHASGFTESELINFKLFVMNNVIECFRQISLSIRKLKIDVPSTEAGLVNKLCKTPEEILNAEQEEQRRDLAAMRSFACVKNLLARVDEINLELIWNEYELKAVHLTYVSFLAELDRILAANYKPTNKDVIHLRASTTGVHEIAFGFKKYVIRLIDVGGQKSERRKWIHCFENVTAVLFVASLSCYDMFLEDDPKTNRLADSIDLFNQMLNNKYLLHCSFILFLNKKDLFEDKLRRVRLSKYFRAYKENGMEMFQEETKDCSRRVYVHFTNAIDTSNIDIVFSAACDIILQSSLQKSGLT
ncbi:unnamed protein product [Toxocara canis]|uniref:G-protein alpha subunit n=1 Tax=Toxocara canis TaxID=6265 RepID=A0A183UND1_TOXCA|nr:unnamed protein product [Toxocara canis]